MTSQRFRNLIFSALISSSALAVQGQGIPDSELVAQFFPQSLMDQHAADYPDLPPKKDIAFIAVDLQDTGQANFLIALYSIDNQDAKVRVLRRDGASTTVVDEPLCKLSGAAASVSVIDLDRGGLKQLLFKLTDDRGNTGAIVFRWTGLKLEPFAPAEVDKLGYAVLLADPEFRDLDGDGILEIVEDDVMGRVKANNDELFSYPILKLNNGKYAKVGVFEELWYAGGSASETYEFSA